MKFTGFKKKSLFSGYDLSRERTIALWQTFLFLLRCFLSHCIYQVHKPQGYLVTRHLLTGDSTSIR